MRAEGLVIIIGGSAQLLSDRNALRAIARLITGDDDCSHEEAMAAAYDFNFGGDDNRIGWVITAVIRAAPESTRLHDLGCARDRCSPHGTTNGALKRAFQKFIFICPMLSNAIHRCSR
jgi:hypothetical protein